MEGYQLWSAREIRRSDPLEDHGHTDTTYEEPRVKVSRDFVKSRWTFWMTKHVLGIYIRSDRMHASQWYKAKCWNTLKLFVMYIHMDTFCRNNIFWRKQYSVKKMALEKTPEKRGFAYFKKICRAKHEKNFKTNSEFKTRILRNLWRTFAWANIHWQNCKWRS